MNEAADAKFATARARMAELKLKFLNRCAADVVHMRRALERFAAGELAAFGDMQHLAHRMNGTGGTLGFDVLSDNAARLETFLDSLPATGPPHATTVASIRARLDPLAAEVARIWVEH